MVVSKYCASGNDFLIFHTFGDVLSFNKSEFASRICDRHYGIGADGMVILKPSDVHGVSYQWEFSMRTVAVCTCAVMLVGLLECMLSSTSWPILSTAS